MTRPLVALSLLATLACASGPGDGSSSGGAPTPTSAGPGYFPAEAVWYRDVSQAALDPQSAAVIAYLDRAGWGQGRMQIDFSIEVVTAEAGTPLRPFTPTDDHFRPDCDRDPVPVPPGGALEGEQGYECRGDGDCLLSDAGRVALTARSDRFTRAKWAGLLGALDLAALRPRDFEMIGAGERIALTNDCAR